MKPGIPFKKYAHLAVFITALTTQIARAELRAKLEILEPFASTFLTESLTLFVRITNTGDRPVSFSMGTKSELFFETDRNAPGSAENQITRRPSLSPPKPTNLKLLPNLDAPFR